MTQFFKGDSLEVRMKAVGDPLFDLTDTALMDFYNNGFDCSAFLLMLYDEGRMPFSDKIPRKAFVDFIKAMLDQFPFTGTFDVYLFVLMSIFGAQSEVNFIVPAPGKLEIDINAIANSEFDFIVREFIDGEYVFYNLVDDDFNQIIFRGLPGIETEYELNLLFSEIMPAGIVPIIALTFYSYSFWIAEEPGPTFFEMTDDDGNLIVFREIGG